MYFELIKLCTGPRTIQFGKLLANYLNKSNSRKIEISDKFETLKVDQVLLFPTRIKIHFI